LAFVKLCRRESNLVKEHCVEGCESSLTLSIVGEALALR
jgi:hypothetical protein